MGAIMGAHVVVATPSGKWAISEKVVSQANAIAKNSGAKIEITNDPVAAAYSGFEEFVLRGTEELPRVGRPQVDYLRAPDREVDFVGRTETFADDLAEVERRLGGRPAPVPHRNRSPHGSYRDYYTAATRAKVAEVYAADLEAFGYTF